MTDAPTSTSPTQDWFYNDSQNIQGPISAGANPDTTSPRPAPGGDACLEGRVPELDGVQGSP